MRRTRARSLRSRSLPRTSGGKRRHHAAARGQCLELTLSPRAVLLRSHERLRTCRSAHSPLRAAERFRNFVLKGQLYPDGARAPPTVRAPAGNAHRTLPGNANASWLIADIGRFIQHRRERTDASIPATQRMRTGRRAHHVHRPSTSDPNEQPHLAGTGTGDGLRHEKRRSGQMHHGHGRAVPRQCHTVVGVSVPQRRNPRGPAPVPSRVASWNQHPQDGGGSGP